MFRLGELLLVGVVLIACVVALVASEPCTLCADGTPLPNDDADFEAAAVIRTVNCSYINSFIHHSDSSMKICSDMQVIGYRYCQCPTYPEDLYCSMCEGGNFNIPNDRKIIPLAGGGGGGDGGGGGGGAKTCGDYLFHVRDNPSDPNACDAYERAAYHCGCPEAVPSSCSFCPVTSDDDNGGGSNNKVAHPLRKVPPSFDFTCQEYNEAESLQRTDDECAALGSNLPIDVRAYCGCPAEKPAAPSTCNLCGGGDDENDAAFLSASASSSYQELLLTDPDLVVNSAHGLTCQSYVDMAAATVDTSFCSSIQLLAGATCCKGHSVPSSPLEPTQQPTAGAPTRAPVATGDEEPTTLVSQATRIMTATALPQILCVLALFVLSMD